MLFILLITEISEGCYGQTSRPFLTTTVFTRPGLMDFNARAEESTGNLGLSFWRYFRIKTTLKRFCLLVLLGLGYVTWMGLGE